MKLVTSNEKMLECLTTPPPPGGHSLKTPNKHVCLSVYRYVQPQRVCFSDVLVINRVSILADFGHLGHSKKVWFLNDFLFYSTCI